MRPPAVAGERHQNHGLASGAPEPRPCLRPTHQMRLIVVGLSHKTAPVEKREKASLSEAPTRALLRDPRASEVIGEGVALSTCNRTELYAAAADLAAAERVLLAALVKHTQIEFPELRCAGYTLRDERAVHHLLNVASSLDSMVVGEREIQGQVRSCWQLAADEQSVGPVLNRLFHHALATGKRVRTQTNIGRGPTSVSSGAVRLARDALPDLARRRVLLIGTGHVARAAAACLAAEGVEEIVVVNRSADLAYALAASVGGRGVGFERLSTELAEADIVISATDAPHMILARDEVVAAMADRPDRPMMLIDIAVPRDLDDTIRDIPGVWLRDIDDLECVVQASLNGRRVEAERAEVLVAEELARFVTWQRTATAAPMIAALHGKAETIRRQEIARLDGRWESLSDGDRARIDALTGAIVAKLLHEPTLRLRAAVQEVGGNGDLEILRRLIDLEPAERGLSAKIGSDREEQPQ
jgi:glutamyl-tRNA reductase